jgi:hypothetical protein
MIRCFNRNALHYSSVHINIKCKHWFIEYCKGGMYLRPESYLQAVNSIQVYLGSKHRYNILYKGGIYLCPETFTTSSTRPVIQ